MFVYHVRDFVKKNVSKIDKTKAQINTPIWRDLMAHIKKTKY